MLINIFEEPNQTERLNFTISFQLKALSTNDNTIHQANFASAFATPTLLVPKSLYMCVCVLVFDANDINHKVTQLSFSSRALHYSFMCLKHQLYFINCHRLSQLMLHYWNNVWIIHRTVNSSKPREEREHGEGCGDTESRSRLFSSSLRWRTGGIWMIEGGRLKSWLLRQWGYRSCCSPYRLLLY